MPDDAALAVLYPSMTPAEGVRTEMYPSMPEPEPEQPAEPTKPTGEPKTPAEILYGNKDAPLPVVDVPDDIKAAREADQLRQMYNPQKQLAHVIRDDYFTKDGAETDLPPLVQKAVVREMREMAADLGMGADDVRSLRAIGQTIKVAPSDAQRMAWREQAVTQLNATYGKDAKGALRDAAKFIAQDPRRAKALEAQGLGDHPDAVLMFAKLARQARNAGKLK
jgi:hypothetical protein